MAREMKDSGVEWIGEIPREWEVVKLKKIAKIQTGNTPSKVIDDVKYYCNKDENDGFLWVKPNDLNGFKFITDSTEKLTKEGKEVARIAPENSILVCCIGSIGKFGIINSEVAFNQQINCVTFSSEIFFKYGVYLIASSESQHWLYSNGNVVKILNNEGQGKIIYPIPPLEEQEKIANYLDKKVSDIDLIIEKTKATIEDYKKYKQSIITEAVTKGINPNVEMKDSGVEWIGEIPKHWGNRRLRFLGSCQNGISKSAEYFGKGFPFISYGDVYKNFILPENPISLVESNEKDRELYSVKYGDVFFTRTSETIEEIGFTSTCLKTVEDAVFAGFIIRFRPYNLKELSPYFSKYYFRSNIHRKFFVKEMNLVTRASLSQELLKKLIVLLPPLEEQNQIAEYLDKRTFEIDTLITKKEALIVELEEYKKSLIYECVTGKKEIK